LILSNDKFLFSFAGCRNEQGCNSNDESENCPLENDSNKESNKSSSPGNKDNADSDSCCYQMEKSHLGGKKSCCSSSKINDCSGGRVLRYALHLRFLCPSSKKKSSKSMLRCKSDPSSAPYSRSPAPEEERKFYLYNDLRVVFPQRHSDSDEGEVCLCIVTLFLPPSIWYPVFFSKKYFSKKQVLTINCSLHVSFCSCEWSMISPLIPSTSTLATDVCLWSIRMYSLRQIRTCKYFHRD
jgi:hypothetical protein